MSIEVEREELGYVTIRQHGSGDYEALKRFYVVNLPTNPFRSFITEDAIFKQRAIIFIAENDGEKVGSLFYTPGEDHAYLHSLVVKKECRGQGIAAEMLKAAQEQAEADGFAEITIEARNDDLIRYYESLGFRCNPNIEKGLVKDIISPPPPISSPRI